MHFEHCFDNDSHKCDDHGIVHGASDIAGSSADEELKSQMLIEASS